jgi:hypothetical protein
LDYTSFIVRHQADLSEADLSQLQGCMLWLTARENTLSLTRQDRLMQADVVTPGAQLHMAPYLPGSSSALMVGCVLCAYVRMYVFVYGDCGIQIVGLEEAALFGICNR